MPDSGTDGFAEVDTDFEEARAERVRLVDAFLAAMAKADNPGTDRKLGSLLRQVTGQHPDPYWSVRLEGDEDDIVVFADGRHGWGHAFMSSDRPVAPAEEIPAARLADGLRALLDANDVPRPDDLR